MISTLPEVKRELKAMHRVIEVTVDIQAFGEGFDTHVNVDYFDKYINMEFKSFQMGDEEKFSKAEARAKRIVESLNRAGYKATYEGLANC